jgi:hypothetical protein
MRRDLANCRNIYTRTRTHDDMTIAITRARLLSLRVRVARVPILLLDCRIELSQLRELVVARLHITQHNVITSKHRMYAYRYSLPRLAERVRDHLQILRVPRSHRRIRHIHTRRAHLINSAELGERGGDLRRLRLRHQLLVHRCCTGHLHKHHTMHNRHMCVL